MRRERERERERERVVGARCFARRYEQKEHSLTHTHRDREREKERETWSADRHRRMITPEAVKRLIITTTKITATMVGTTRIIIIIITTTTTTTEKPLRCSEATCGRPARCWRSSSLGCLKPRQKGVRVEGGKSFVLERGREREREDVPRAHS